MKTNRSTILAALFGGILLGQMISPGLATADNSQAEPLNRISSSLEKIATSLSGIERKCK